MCCLAIAKAKAGWGSATAGSPTIGTWRSLVFMAIKKDREALHYGQWWRVTVASMGRQAPVQVKRSRMDDMGQRCLSGTPDSCDVQPARGLGKE